MARDRGGKRRAGVFFILVAIRKFGRLPNHRKDWRKYMAAKKRMAMYLCDVECVLIELIAKFFQTRPDVVRRWRSAV